MRVHRFASLAFACCVVLGFRIELLAADPPAGGKSALDDYVAKKDDTYSWKLVKTIPGDGYTAFVVDLKSQTWRTTADVNRTVWQHWLTIVKPDGVKYDTAHMRIGGGKNGGQPPDKPNTQMVELALHTN